MHSGRVRGIVVYAISSDSHCWNQTLTIATSFWCVYLVLVAVEAVLGSNAVIAGLFFVSVPLLVGVLTWVNLGIVFRRPRRRLWSVFALGAAVLGYSTVIMLVGLLAAANLKHLLIA